MLGNQATAEYRKRVLIPPAQLAHYWGLHPARILHVGAHQAEESRSYRDAGWGSEAVVWVEADPASAQTLRDRLEGDAHAHVVEALAWDVSGVEVDFHIASNGQSSSALAMGEHREFFPDITVVNSVRMLTQALDELPAIQELRPFQLINLDIQGSELKALRGLQQTIAESTAIYTEVNTRPLYEGCALLPELDAFLADAGFVRVDLVIVQDGWGDGLWIRRPDVPRLAVARRGARKADAFGARVRRRVGRR